MTQYRQGDVLLDRLGRKPSNLRPAPRDEHDRVVLAHGERTGHAHVFRASGVQAFFRETAETDALVTGFRTPDVILVGGSTAALGHEHVTGRQAEHNPIPAAPGTYRVLVPVEHTDEDEPMRVAD